MLHATPGPRSVASISAVWLRTIQSVAALSLTALAAAAPVQVQVKSKEQGQGMLLQRADTCYLLTAEHVVRGTDRANLVGSTGARRFGEAKLVHRFMHEDLALLRVSGALARECGGEFDEHRDDLGRTLSARPVGSLARVFDSDKSGPEGGTGRVPIVVTDVGPVWLRIKTTQNSEKIEQGLSGGGVFVADRLAGVLVSVEDEGGVTIGKVMRIDHAIALIDRFFANPKSADPDTEKPSAVQAPSATVAATAGPTFREPTGNLLSVAAGATVVAWNSPPSSPEFSPSNLIDASRPHSWNAQAKRLPVEVDFRLVNGQAQTIGRLEFVLAQDQDSARAARDVEVLTSIDGALWRPIHTGTLFNNEAVKSVPMAPLRAAYLRLRIYSNWGEAGWVSLRQVRAFKE